MKSKKEFLKRRVEEALFIFRLFERYKEKMPCDPLIGNLAMEYKEKYELLLKEYTENCANDAEY